jgi:Domain of unknown function (DUF4160)
MQRSRLALILRFRLRLLATLTSVDRECRNARRGAVSPSAAWAIASRHKQRGGANGRRCRVGRKRGVRLTSGQTAPFIRTRRSRDNRCQAMSGMPPAGAAAWVACLPSVGSSGSRSRCFRRPRAASFARSPCAGQRQVRIDSLEVIDSSLPRRQLRFVLAWAELHQAELHENWRRARAGETLQPIEPLR